ncbi:MAG: glutamyl-tRNA reductase [Terriglobales bacterium]
MEPTLVVVGLNHKTAAVEIRERFWMSGCRQAEVLSMLAQAEGIEEAIVFSTSNRTEFVLWGDATLAVNSILRLLTAEYDLKLQEWNSFYRLLDEQALIHAFRVSCGLNSMYIGEGHIARQFAMAWQQARNAACTGRHLDAVLRRCLAVRRRVRKETEFVSHLVSAPLAATRFAEQAFGSLAGKNIVIFGAGHMAESAARELSQRAPQSLLIFSRNDSSAQELVFKLRAHSPAVHAGTFAERWDRLADADLVISATSSQEFIFTADDMRRLAIARNQGSQRENDHSANDNLDGHPGNDPKKNEPVARKLIFIDLALPRDIDPAVRAFEGVLLYDIEDLERAVEPRKDVSQKVASQTESLRKEGRTLELRSPRRDDRIRNFPVDEPLAGARPGEHEAEQIVQSEVREFKKELLLGTVPPEVSALRSRLDEICRQELESFRIEQGPFPKDQDKLIAALGLRLTHKIAGTLARDLKTAPESRAPRRMIAGA